jgi:hypothetical protein
MRDCVSQPPVSPLLVIIYLFRVGLSSFSPLFLVGPAYIICRAGDERPVMRVFCYDMRRVWLQSHRSLYTRQSIDGKYIKEKRENIYKAHNKRWSVYTLLLAPVHRPSVQVPSIWSIPIDTDERGVYTLHTADEVLCVWHQIRHVVLYSADAIHISSMGSIFVYTSSLFISFFLNPDWIWCL